MRHQDSDTYEEMVDELFETITIASNDFTDWEENFIQDMKDLRLKYDTLRLSDKQKIIISDLYEKV